MTVDRIFIWKTRDQYVDFRRVRVMAIINLTPDSFSDGGQFSDLESALLAAAEAERRGADIIDVGGESTRPGAIPISADEEWARLAPFFAAVSKHVSLPISVDTYHPETAGRALDAGAHIINDVTGLRSPEMRHIVAAAGAGCVLVHHENMVEGADPVLIVQQFFDKRIELCVESGINLHQICLDPGIGFGKSMEQNLELIRRMGEIRSYGLPIMAAASRKRVIAGAVGELPPRELDPGTVAAHTAAILAGADMIRVHDVPSGVQCARMAELMRNAESGMRN